ncbi:MAG: rhomboid family intramembrane serine protease [Saprospiraceae bacterium]
MFGSIWEDIKREFSYGNMVSKLVIVNVMVFLAINLTWVIIRVSNGYQDAPIFWDILSFFSISSNWLELLTHPWGLITNMFLHEGFFHLLFNMLMLYWFGRIVGDLLGDHRILPLYLLSGMAGAVVFFISANVLGYTSESIAYGASGAVMGIVIAAAALAPDMEIRLLLFGNVKLKYIAAVLLIIDIIGIGSMNNTGGHFAHLGGAAFGFYFIYRLRQGDDLSAPINKAITAITDFFRRLGQPKDSAPRRGPKVAYKNPKASATTGRGYAGRSASEASTKSTPREHDERSHQERVDAILEKIKESGYDNLTEEEKHFLFNASKK